MSASKINLNKEIIALFSGQSSILTIPKLYVQITGSHSLALVLNQCVFWANKSSLPDGWFYKKYSEWFEEIHIPERTLRRQFEKLSTKGWIKTKTKMVNGINIIHFKPDMDKIIESIKYLLNENPPNRPLCPNGSNNELKNCTKVAPSGHIGRTESATLSDSSIYTDNNKQIINPIQAPVGARLLSSFGLKEMLEDNPHGIPEPILSDWLEVRKGKKAKMTATAWEQANQNLAKLKDAGLSPVDCFKKAVGNGWAGVEFRYFKQDIDALNPSNAVRFTSKDERAANELKIRERELKAQEEKRREIDDAHNFKKIHSIVSSRPDLTELQTKHEEERKKLGLTALQYHKVILNKLSASSV